MGTVMLTDIVWWNMLQRGRNVWLVFQYMRTLTIWLYLTGLRLSNDRFGILHSLKLNYLMFLLLYIKVMLDIKTTVFWAMTPYRLLQSCRRFRGTAGFHIQPGSSETVVSTILILPVVIGLNLRDAGWSVLNIRSLLYPCCQARDFPQLTAV